MKPFKALEVDFHDADEIFYKQISLPEGAMVPQHAHDYDHTTLLARGSVRLWCDGQLYGDVSAPSALLIKAHSKHIFLALEDTVLYCIHNLRGRGEYAVSEEHKWHLA